MSSQRMRSFKDQMWLGKSAKGILEVSQALSWTNLSAPGICPLSDFITGWNRRTTEEKQGGKPNLGSSSATAQPSQARRFSAQAGTGYTREEKYFEHRGQAETMQNFTAINGTRNSPAHAVLGLGEPFCQGDKQ